MSYTIRHRNQSFWGKGTTAASLVLFFRTAARAVLSLGGHHGRSRLAGGSVTAASFVLGRKLDSIPFSAYQLLIITVLALVGFIEGYDLVITGSLLVLAKGPLHLTGPDILWLAVGPTFMLCVGGFAASAVSDDWSRKSVMLIGVIATTLLTLLIPLVRDAEQLIIVRLLTGLGAGGAVSAAFPIAAELMPAQHRRTYSAIYEMALAGAFTVVPFIAYLLADNPDAFRLLALPGGLAVTVPVLVYLETRLKARAGICAKANLRSPSTSLTGSSSGVAPA